MRFLLGFVGPLAIFALGFWAGKLEATPEVRFVEDKFDCSKPRCSNYVYHTCYDYEKYITDLNKALSQHNVMVWSTVVTSDPRLK